MLRMDNINVCADVGLIGVKLANSVYILWQVPIFNTDHALLSL